jgi:hypothetical protein
MHERPVAGVQRYKYRSVLEMCMRKTAFVSTPRDNLPLNGIRGRAVLESRLLVNDSALRLD